LTLNNGQPIPDIADLWDWSQMHKKEVMNKINSNVFELTKNENATLWLENDEKVFETHSTGILELTKEHLKFKSGSFNKEWNIDQIKEYVIQKKDIFECRDDNTTYRFTFNGHSPMKWIYYFRYLNHFEKCEEQGYY
jgi:hypothetical protein